MRSLQLVPRELGFRQRASLAAGILLIVVLFTSRGLLERTPPTGEAVPWADYPADLRTRIDDHVAGGDCAALGAELGAARADDRSMIIDTGHDNARLIAYIVDQMRAIRC